MVALSVSRVNADRYGSAQKERASCSVSAFYMDKFEVTNEKMRQVLQWAYNNTLVNANAGAASNIEGDTRLLLDLADGDCQIDFSGGVFTVVSGKENFPCIEMTWYGAAAYCNYRSDMEGLSRCIDFTDWSCDFSSNGYRLPTEAEWEKGARGGLTGHHFPWPSLGGSWSNHVDGSKGNYWLSGDDYESGGTRSTPVGYYDGSQKPSGVDMANGYGLYDMAGNVWEWCWDWFQSDWYSQPGATQNDTSGPASGTRRVLRGASWQNHPYRFCCSHRYVGYDPTWTEFDIGFRCVRVP